MRLVHMGFTLVELLVVIAVIVVLLALLAPGLERAVYAAEMAKCMTNLKAIASGGLIYTVDYQRRYFYRAHVIVGAYGAINMNLNSTEPNWDDRIIFRDYISVNEALNCPLNKKLDYVSSRSGGSDAGKIDPNTLCYSDYAMWMGWRVGGERGMYRLGDRFTWKNVFGTGEVHSSNALAASFAQCDPAGTPWYADHPDNNGLWQHWAGENAGDWWNATPLYTVTWSTYKPVTYLEPYVFNMNFVMDDNSVRRIDNITPTTHEEDGVTWTRSWTDPAAALRTPLPAH